MWSVILLLSFLVFVTVLTSLSCCLSVLVNLCDGLQLMHVLFEQPQLGREAPTF